MSSDENTDLLLSLGLSLNKAKVYLAILKLEKTTVGQIAKFSKVRREDVYRLLPSLEKLGLIERLLGKPMEIQATPISDALSFLVSEEKGRFDERLDGMRITVQRLSLNDWKQPLPGEESIYILIADKKAILAKTSRLIRNSRKEVALIADKRRIIPVLSQFSDECEWAIKKGAQIRLIFEGPFASVYRLVNDLETMNRMVVMEKMKITKSNKAQPCRVDLTASVFERH